MITKKRIIYFFLIFLFLSLSIDTCYLISIWPDWEVLQTGPIPESNIIKQYKQVLRFHLNLPDLKWNPINATFNNNITRVFIAAEDGSYYLHEGIDYKALKNALQKNIKKGKIAFGASTISQQTVKNLFLNLSRNPLRKWHEIILTLAMERHLSKSRILTLYLNIVELGNGIFGIEAAARHYFGLSASGMDLAQTAELAATLPSPLKHNPETRTRRFLRRKKIIHNYIIRIDYENSQKKK